MGDPQEEVQDPDLDTAMPVPVSFFEVLHTCSLHTTNAPEDQFGCSRPSQSQKRIRPSDGSTSHHRTSDARVAPRGARKRPEGDHGRPSADDVESLSVGTEAGTGPLGLSPTGFPVIAERLA